MVERSLVKQLIAFISERLFTVVLSGVLGIFIARYLGPEGLGLLSLIQSIYLLVVPVALLGMRQILVRELSSSENDLTLLVSALALQIPVAITLALFAFCIVILTKGTQADVLLMALVLLPLPLLSLSTIIRAYWESKGDVKVLVSATLTSSVIASIAKALVILLRWEIWLFALITTIEAAIHLVLLLVHTKKLRNLVAVKSAFSKQVLKNLFFESWPLLIAGFSYFVYKKIDVVMLGLLAGDIETGNYVAAANLSEIAYFVPFAAAAALRPYLARLYFRSKTEEYNLATSTSVFLHFWIAVLGALICYQFSDQIVELIYGPQYSTSSDILKIHILALPFVYVGVASNQWFFDRGLTKEVMTRHMCGATVNLLLNLILIPQFGGIGAAVATALSYAFAWVLMNWILKNTRDLFYLQLRSILGLNRLKSTNHT